MPQPPLVLPELFRQHATLAPALLRLARHARYPAALAADGSQASAIAVDLLRQQAERMLQLKVCPGRSDLARRASLLKLMRARLMIEAQRGVGCNLTQLARVADQSPTHFLRTYRRVFGFTPFEHLVHLRLADAQRLLVTTNERVADIGASLGFNRCAFSRAYRDYHGVSPSQARATSGSRLAGVRAAATATPTDPSTLDLRGH